jgi:hypothetical protein
MLIGGQHRQDYGFPTAMPNGGLPSAIDSLMAWSCCPNFIFAKKGAQKRLARIDKARREA